MSAKQRVLVFPAGSEIGLEIHASLRYSHHLEVFGASGKSDHAAFVYDASNYVEDTALYIGNEDFLERFNAVLRRLAIDFVYPTHDSIACFLADRQQELAAQVITSCAETNRIARSKSETYRSFCAFDFCPAVYGAPYADLDFPVFLKPDAGQGGKGTYRVDDREALDFHLERSPDLLVTEYLPGEELSVDCFTDFRGQLLFVGPRTRERVQMGISFRSGSVPLADDIRSIADSINRTVSLDGAWFFQVKRSASGRWKLLEFAPRQASTMGLYRHAGVNFALLGYFNARRMPVEIMRNRYAIQLDRCLHNRFRADFDYHTVYIDFDETLIADGKVHERVVAFLYQCRNRGVKCILLTKHRHDLLTTLRAHAISRDLFAQIMHIDESDPKWECIDPDGAIFIDNHWLDRREVSERLGIPVFDVDAVECLLR